MSQLNVEKREPTQNLRNLRMAGKVPAVVYGNDKSPVMVTLESVDLRKEYSKRGFFSRVLTLNVNGESVDVLAKDIQLDPVRDHPVHADFMRINKEQKIRISVPIDYQNSEKSPAIKKGGVANFVHHKLEVRCSPYAIPEALICDLSTLDTHKPATLASLNLPANITPVHAARDNILATVVAATEEKGAEAAEAAAPEEAKK